MALFTFFGMNRPAFPVFLLVRKGTGGVIGGTGNLKVGRLVRLPHRIQKKRNSRAPQTTIYLDFSESVTFTLYK